jgi:hypothetical protein
MQVNVPSIGLVNFPDSMSQDEVTQGEAIKGKFNKQGYENRWAKDNTTMAPVQGLGGQILQGLTAGLTKPLPAVENAQPKTFLGGLGQAAGEQVTVPNAAMLLGVEQCSRVLVMLSKKVVRQQSKQGLLKQHYGTICYSRCNGVVGECA